MIRRLGPDDAPALASLRRQALTSDPLSFGSSVEDDRLRSLDFVRAMLASDHEHAVFAHVDWAELRGMVGLMREQNVKRHHLATIWGMYVAPGSRSRGVGRALLDAAVAQAGQWSGVEQVHLGVTDAALHARRLYETAGFRTWGCEPRALRWNGRTVNEYHLVLELT